MRHRLPDQLVQEFRCLTATPNRVMRGFHTPERRVPPHEPYITSFIFRKPVRSLTLSVAYRAGVSPAAYPAHKITALPISSEKNGSL